MPHVGCSTACYVWLLFFGPRYRLIKDPMNSCISLILGYKQLLVFALATASKHNL